MESNVFRTAQPEPSVASETASSEVLPVELKDDGNRDKAIVGGEEIKENSLEKWEIENGKYGAEYLGIKETIKEFPYNAQFSQLDKYIKGEMEERGYDKTPKAWQDILEEIENEIDSSKLNAIERLKRVTNYIKVLQKIRELKKKKDSYTT